MVNGPQNSNPPKKTVNESNNLVKISHPTTFILQSMCKQYVFLIICGIFSIWSYGVEELEGGEYPDSCKIFRGVCDFVQSCGAMQFSCISILNNYCVLIC